MATIQCKSCGKDFNVAQMRNGRCPLCGLSVNGEPSFPASAAPTLNYGAPPTSEARKKMFKPWLLLFLGLWLLAQVGAFIGLMQESKPIFYSSLALAWAGGIGMAVCILLQKGQNMAWLLAVIAIWAAPIPLAQAGVNLPSSMGTIVWVAGIFLLQKLPDKYKAPVGSEVSV